MNEKPEWYRVEEDPTLKTLTLIPNAATGHKLLFACARPDAEHLVLDGTLDGAAVTVRLRHLDESTFLLVNRGFHWVNEYPFNRRSTYPA
jgi:hypothetical protein